MISWCSLFMQTYAVAPRLFFWVSKLNILDGLFLEPSASCACVCVLLCVYMCVCVCVTPTLPPFAVNAGCLTHKVLVSWPRGSSAACCVIKEVIINYSRSTWRIQQRTAAHSHTPRNACHTWTTYYTLDCSILHVSPCVYAVISDHESVVIVKKVFLVQTNRFHLHIINTLFYVFTLGGSEVSNIWSFEWINDADLSVKTSRCLFCWSELTLDQLYVALSCEGGNRLV